MIRHKLKINKLYNKFRIKIKTNKLSKILIKIENQQQSNNNKLNQFNLPFSRKI